MIVYHQHYHAYLEICRCFKAVYESEGVQEDPDKWMPVRVRVFGEAVVEGREWGVPAHGCRVWLEALASRLPALCASAPPCLTQVLKKICWYAVLAPSYSTDEGSSSDVATLIATTAAYKQLSDLPLHQQLLATFTNSEIIRWGLFEAQYGPEIAAEVSRLRGNGGVAGLRQPGGAGTTVACEGTSASCC
jgi:hypothetical protein